MKKYESLSSSKEFSIIYSSAKKWYSEYFITFYKHSIDSKFSVVVSKKVGKAVIRNRSRRLIKAAFFDISSGLKDGIYVVVVRAGLEKIPFLQIKKNLQWSLRKLECML